MQYTCTPGIILSSDFMLTTVTNNRGINPAPKILYKTENTCIYIYDDDDDDGDEDEDQLYTR